MQRTLRKILLRSIGIIFFTFVIIFAYNRFGRYIDGPEITTINIEPYQTVDTLSLPITGTVKNVETISIEGREIIYDDTYTFNDIIVLSPGYTIIDIVVTDPFGKEQIYSYSIETTAENPEPVAIPTEEPLLEPEALEESPIEEIN